MITEVKCTEVASAQPTASAGPAIVGAVTPDQLAALPLRERKQALTRAAIVKAAQRLSEERGFDDLARCRHVSRAAPTPR
jgi:hypothetical protein